MDFSTKSADKKNSLQTIKTDCLAIGIYSNGTLADDNTSPALQKTVAQLYATGDIDGKAGSTLLVQSPEGIAAKRLLLIGLGSAPVTAKEFRKAVDACLGALKPLNTPNVLLALPMDAVNNNTDQTIYTVVTGFYDKTYQSGVLKKDKGPASRIRKAVLYIPSDKAAIAKKALTHAIAINEGRQY
ncbi:MAG: M17 family peptidase N-terminal domain-containing protein, partial [Oxalobacter sp.]